MYARKMADVANDKNELERCVKIGPFMRMVNANAQLPRNAYLTNSTHPQVVCRVSCVRTSQRVRANQINDINVK